LQRLKEGGVAAPPNKAAFWRKAFKRRCVGFGMCSPGPSFQAGGMGFLSRYSISSQNLCQTGWKNGMLPGENVGDIVGNEET